MGVLDKKRSEKQRKDTESELEVKEHRIGKKQRKEKAKGVRRGERRGRRGTKKDEKGVD